MVKARDTTPSPASPISPQHPLLDRLHLLTHHVKGRMHQAVMSEGEGLAPMEARVLSFFARQPGSTQSTLVQHSGRDKAQIARIVKLLQERGLLSTAADPADGRSVLIRPTEAGRAMHRRMHQQRVQVEAELMAALSPAQQRQLLAGLDLMLSSLPDRG